MPIREAYPQANTPIATGAFCAALCSRPNQSLISLPMMLPSSSGLFHVQALPTPAGAPIPRDVANGCSKSRPAVIAVAMSLRPSLFALLVACSVSLGSTGCGGGSTPPPRDETAVAHVATRNDQSDISVGAEVGGLNEEATEKVFQRAEPAFERCFKHRAKSVELLAGTVKFFVVIGMDQKAQSISIEESDLGDRDAEKCMVKVLLNSTWPKPVGGRTAHARYTAATFEPLDPDVRAAAAVEPDQVKKVQGKLKQQVSDCQIDQGSHVSVTAYLDTSGKVITASASSPDPNVEGHIDCLLDLVKSAEFPSPGSYAGKVTFQL